MKKTQQSKTRLIKVQQELFYELEEIRLALARERESFLSKSATLHVLLESYKKHTASDRM